MSPSENELHGHHVVDADVVVVGAGAGGSAIAYEMASRGMKVVILEEGHRYQPHNFPASYGWALNHIYADKGARVLPESSVAVPVAPAALIFWPAWSVR